MKRVYLSVAVGILVVCALGAAMVVPLQEKAMEASDFLKMFTGALSTVQSNYMEEVDSQRLIFGAIRGMLGALDPHTNFLDQRTFRSLQRNQEGSFFGIGVSIAMRGEELTIISPIEGSPAHRLGIQAGDVIAEIEGESTKGMDIETILSKLRGAKGTKVTITISRRAYPEPLVFTIVRDEIKAPNILVSFMLREGVGYIRFSRFAFSSAKDLDETLVELEEQGMKRLILDLRGNTGGFLDQAVKVADKFIPEGKIVEMRGKAMATSQIFFATEERTRPYIPLIVMVNLGSASASEIVAGAIQDHDRGLIVGETTWGKGLVQSVYRLSQQTALSLTTAKYYTPSGRSIQRDYTSSWEEYFFPSPETLTPKSEEVFTTVSGRKVYGGGGIVPDVAISSTILSELAQRVQSRNTFFNFATQYVNTHPDIDRTFEVTSSVVEEFKEFLAKEEIAYSPDDFDAETEYIKMRIKQEVCAHKWGLAAGYQILVQADPSVQKALELFPQAVELLQQREATLQQHPS